MGVHRFSLVWVLIVGLSGVFAQVKEEELPPELADWIIAHNEYRTPDESVSAPNPTTEDSTADTDGLLRVTGTGSPENSNRRDSMPWKSQEYRDLLFEDGEETLRRLSEATKTERAKYQEGLDRHMQAHQSTIPDQWSSFQDPSVDDGENRTQSQQEYAESAVAIKPQFASPGSSNYRWTPEEENIILEEFAESIEREQIPSIEDIQAVKDKHQILRSAEAIRKWIRRYRTNKHTQKTSPGGSRRSFMAEEKNILLEEFEESIKKGILPPTKKIQAVIDKHKLLSGRSHPVITQWIRHYIKSKNTQKSKTSTITDFITVSLIVILHIEHTYK